MLMASDTINLSHGILGEIFPFHIAVDSNLRIRQVGDALARRYPELTADCDFARFFHIVQPEIKTTYHDLLDNLHSVFIIETVATFLKLKGQFVSDESKECLVFLGSPLIVDMGQVEDLGLSLNDFAPHHMAADYLLALQFRQVALEDARRLTTVLSQQRARLQESEKRYRSVVENVKDVIFQTDSDGMWTFLNPAWTEITGYSVQESLGKHFAEFVHPDDRQRNLDLFVPLIQRRKSYCRHEVRYLTRDGGYRWMEVFARLTLDDSDKSTGTAGTLSDITERKWAEQALKEREERLRSIVTTAVDGIIVINSHGIIEDFNVAAERIFGYSNLEAIGQNISLLMPEPYSSTHDLHMGRFLRTGESNAIGITRELAGMRKDGTVFPLEISVSAMHAGLEQRFTGIVRDITERKLWEHTLREAESAMRESALAIAQARAIEVEIGARIQQTLLISSPPASLNGVSICAKSTASCEIAGDYLDFVRYDQHHLDLIVGDVMGKGVPAALLAAAAKSHFQRVIGGLCLSLGKFNRIPEPEEIVSAAHTVMTPELAGIDSYITLSYARFDLEARKLTLVDCGHPRPIHYRAARDECVYLSGENLPIGFMQTEEYRQVEYSFSPGDLLLFYSDGVTESRAASGELFGIDRLADVLRERAQESVDEIFEHIQSAVTAFSETETASDDLTCVIVRVEPSTGQLIGKRMYREIHASLDELEAARDWFESFAGGAENTLLPEDDLQAFLLAFNEALVNVILHACKGDARHRIQMVLAAYTDRVSVSIYDTGITFDVDSVAEPAFDGTRDNGFGLFIIANCVDEIERGSDEFGRNRLRLTKRRCRLVQ